MPCSLLAQVGQDQVLAEVGQDTVCANVACGEFVPPILDRDNYIDFNIEPNDYVDFDGNFYVDF